MEVFGSFLYSQAQDNEMLRDSLSHPSMPLPPGSPPTFPDAAPDSSAQGPRFFLSAPPLTTRAYAWIC